MRAFYVLMLGLGGLLLFLSLALYLMFGIRELQAPKQLRSKLISFNKQGLLPRSVTMLLGDFVVLGTCGWLLTVQMRMDWFVSLPCALVACAAVNWGVNLLLSKGNEPSLKLSDDLIGGMQGQVVEDITGEMYGKVEFTLKGRKFTVNAVNTNLGNIQKGEKVLLVSHSDDLYFVMAEDHIYDLADL